MIHLLVLVAGAAALSWEVLWQVQASLALGVSSVGTAITLACTMGGMSGGAWAMGRVLRGREVTRPIRLYGLVEAFVGVCGLVMIPAFQALMPMDAALYRASPELAPVAYLAGVAAVLGPPALGPVGFVAHANGRNRFAPVKYPTGFVFKNRIYRQNPEAGSMGLGGCHCPRRL